MKPKIQYEGNVWYLALFPEPIAPRRGRPDLIDIQYNNAVDQAIANKLPVVNPEIIEIVIRINKNWINDSPIESEWHDWPGGYEKWPHQCIAVSCDCRHQRMCVGPYQDYYKLSLPNKEPINSGHSYTEGMDFKPEPVKDNFDRFLPCAPKEKSTFGSRQMLKDKLEKAKSIPVKESEQETVSQLEEEHFQQAVKIKKLDKTIKELQAEVEIERNKVIDEIKKHIGWRSHDIDGFPLTIEVQKLQQYLTSIKSKDS